MNRLPISSEADQELRRCLGPSLYKEVVDLYEARRIRGLAKALVGLPSEYGIMPSPSLKRRYDSAKSRLDSEFSVALRMAEKIVIGDSES